MNQIFNFRRFLFLFRKTIAERPTQLLGLWGLTFIVSFLVYFMFKSLVNFEAAQTISFVIGLIGGGCFMTSIVFGNFSTHGSSASYLTLPASVFEKWLAGVMIAGVLYIASFYFFFKGMDIFFVNSFHKSLNPSIPNYKQLYYSVYTMPMNSELVRAFIMFYLNISGAMLIGSIAFNKASFIKVAIIFCVLFSFAFLFNYLFAKMLFPNLDRAAPFHNVFLLAKGEVGIIELPQNLVEAMDYIVLLVLPLILWTTSFLRLKEKEV